MEKIRTTIYINKELFNKFKIYAITLNTSVSALIEKYILDTVNKLEGK